MLRTDPDEESSIFDATFGGNWAEQMLCVAYHEGVNRGRITLPRLVQVMCENPAKIFGLYPKKRLAGCRHGRGHSAVSNPAVEHTAVRGGAALPCRLHDVRGQGCHRATDNDDAEGRDTGGERCDAQAEGSRASTCPVTGTSRLMRPNGHAVNVANRSRALEVAQATGTRWRAAA